MILSYKTSFLERYPFDHSQYPWKRMADAVMQMPSRDLESNCRSIREFIDTMGRPMLPGMLNNLNQVRAVMSTYERPWLGMSQPSPNGRLLLTYQYFPGSNELRISRDLFVRMKNIDQIHRVAHQFQRPNFFLSVDGAKTFHSTLESITSPRPWYYTTDNHVCYSLHADVVMLDDMNVYNSIYLIAPKVRR